MGSWLLPCSLPHLTESERAGAWRGLSDTCKWKWDPTWKQTRESLGAGRRGKLRQTLPSFAWSNIPPLCHWVPGSGIPKQDPGPERTQRRSGAPQGSLGTLADLAPAGQRFWLLGDSQPQRRPHCLQPIPTFMSICGQPHGRDCSLLYLKVGDTASMHTQERPLSSGSMSQEMSLSAPGNTRHSASHPLSKRTTARKRGAQKSNELLFAKSNLGQCLNISENTRDKSRLGRETMNAVYC